MDANLLHRVNHLWEKVYPYLAAEIAELYGKDSGAMLELGPFSGGIARELARLRPGLDITIGDESPAVLTLLKQWLSPSPVSGKIHFSQTPLDHLSFAAGHFDLVIVRGLYFFLENRKDLLPEVYRVLRPEGLAVIGGGYGRRTPASVIDEIAEESRVLNEQLGRKRVTIEDLEDEVQKAGLSGCAEIITEGGLWIHVRRTKGQEARGG